MSYFLVEIRMPADERLQVQCAVRAVEAAENRLSRRGVAVHAVRARGGFDAGLLRWRVEAPSLDAVRRLLAVALLPPARIRPLPDRPPL